MAIFKGAKNRDDTFVGGGRPDTFLFDPADLTSSDTVVGGGGRRADTLRFAATGTVTASMMAGVSQIERINLADGTNIITLDDALASSATAARLTIVGANGDDSVDASALTGADAVSILAGMGNDHLVGGAGADQFTFDVAAFDAADHVQGGSGEAIDTLVLAGGGRVAAGQLAGVTGIEVITLGDLGVAIDPTIALIDSAAFGSLKIVGGAGADTIDASGITTRGSAQNPFLRLVGGGGNDVITGSSAIYTSVDGGAGSDTIRINRGSVVYDGKDVVQTAANGILFVNSATRIDLTNAADQSNGDRCVVQGFVTVSAEASNQSVTLRGGVGNELDGGSAADVISGAQSIDGGGGADILTGGKQGTTFFIGAGDFERGEVIRGISDQDALVIGASVDLRRGTVEGIETIGFAFSYPPTGEPIIVTMSTTQALGLRAVQWSGSPEPAPILEVIMERGVALLPNLITREAVVNVTGTGGEDVIQGSFNTVHAGGGNDTISALSSIYGEDGNDTLVGAYLGGHRTLDGGAGTDTVSFQGRYYDFFDPKGPVIDLASSQNQIKWDDMVMTGFENVDLSILSLHFKRPLSVSGNDGANVLIGSGDADILAGRGGDDVLEGGSGVDMLTGGAGADLFRWTAFAPVSKFDKITDFTQGEDRLQFEHGAFGVAGDAFDTRVVIAEPGTSIAGADLVIATGAPFDSVRQVFQFLDEATGASGSGGIFVAGADADGHTLLYYSSSADPRSLDQIMTIADLGNIGDPTQLSLSDFAFI